MTNRLVSSTILPHTDWHFSQTYRAPTLRSRPRCPRDWKEVYTARGEVFAEFLCGDPSTSYHFMAQVGQQYMDTGKYRHFDRVSTGSTARSTPLGRDSPESRYPIGQYVHDQLRIIWVVCFQMNREVVWTVHAGVHGEGSGLMEDRPALSRLKASPPPLRSGRGGWLPFRRLEPSLWVDSESRCTPARGPPKG